jgi:hypothetical protein
MTTKTTRDRDKWLPCQEGGPARGHLYDGETQHVSPEPESGGADQRGERAGDEPQRHPQRRQAGAARDDLVLLRHEQPCTRTRTACMHARELTDQYVVGVTASSSSVTASRPATRHPDMAADGGLSYLSVMSGRPYPC